MIQMAILTASTFIIYIVFTPSLGIIKLIITGVTPENILGTGFNRMQFSNRSRIIHLESLFHRIRFPIGMEIVQFQFFNDILIILVKLNIPISII